MYICKKHGKQPTDWCSKCNKLLVCDCSTTTCTRFKDLIYDCDGGERTITIYLYHCEVCGEVINIE